MAVAVALLLAGGLATGVVPAFAAAAAPAAATFVDQHGYLATALPLSNFPHTTWTTTGALLGFLAAALAIAVALAGLYIRGVPAWVRSGLHGLHRLHSGHIGDYAAWLVLGTAVFAGLLAQG